MYSVGTQEVHMPQQQLALRAARGRRAVCESSEIVLRVTELVASGVAAVARACSICARVWLSGGRATYAGSRRT